MICWALQGRSGKGAWNPTGQPAHSRVDSERPFRRAPLGSQDPGVLHDRALSWPPPPQGTEWAPPAGRPSAGGRPQPVLGQVRVSWNAGGALRGPVQPVGAPTRAGPQTPPSAKCPSPQPRLWPQLQLSSSGSRQAPPRGTRMVGQGRRLPLQGQGATRGWTASAFQAPRKDGGGSGTPALRHLPGLPESGRPAWQDREGQMAAAVGPLLCSAPPVNLCHPRDASDQIWGFLHAVIGSQEVLTGLGRRLPSDTGGKWLSHDLGAWARDESWFPILTSVLLASLPGPGRAKGHSEGAWSRLWLLSPLLLIN